MPECVRFRVLHSDLTPSHPHTLTGHTQQCEADQQPCRHPHTRVPPHRVTPALFCGGGASLRDQLDQPGRGTQGNQATNGGYKGMLFRKKELRYLAGPLALFYQLCLVRCGLGLEENSYTVVQYTTTEESVLLVFYYSV